MALGRIPTELDQQIDSAENMNGREIGAYAATSRRLRRQLADRLHRGLIMRRIRSIVAFRRDCTDSDLRPTFQRADTLRRRLLGLIMATLERLNELPLHAKGRPLLAVAEGIASVDRVDRPGVFRQVLTCVNKMTEDERHQTLRTLVGQIGFVWKDERTSIFKELLASLGGMAERQRAELLTTLARALILLPDEQRVSVLHEVITCCFSLASQARFGPLTALARQLYARPEPAQLLASRAPLTALGGMNRADEVMEYCELINFQLKRNQIAEFEAILSAVQGLDVFERVTPLRVLAVKLRALPEEAREKAFHDLLEALRAVPDEQQGHALTTLGRSLQSIPQPAQAACLNRVLDVLRALPRDYRGSALTVVNEEIEYSLISAHLPEGTGMRWEIR